MASRTRNRVLGIAVLFGAMVAIALLVVLSHDGDKQQVTPLKDTTQKPQEAGKGGEVVLGKPWVEGRSADSGERTRKARRIREHHRTSTGGAALGAVSADDRKSGRDDGARMPRTPVTRPVSPRPLVPGPSGPPIQPTSPGTAPHSPEPVSTEPAEEPGDGDADTPSVPDTDTHVDRSDVPEVVISNGEIEHGGNRLKTLDGHLRLRIRSDQLVLVEVEDRALSWLVPAAGDALIEFDTSEKAYKLELKHRKTGLVLRLRD